MRSMWRMSDLREQSNTRICCLKSKPCRHAEQLFKQCHAPGNSINLGDRVFTELGPGTLPESDGSYCLVNIAARDAIARLRIEQPGDFLHFIAHETHEKTRKGKNTDVHLLTGGSGCHDDKRYANKETQSTMFFSCLSVCFVGQYSSYAFFRTIQNGY